MTNERAIEILKCNFRGYNDISDEETAISMAVSALEKQIPKKPDYEGDGYDENGELIYDTAYCPVCEHEFEFEINDWGCNFCSDCGQALDWRDKE